VVVYRRPVEARAIDDDDLADLVRDVVVEQVAHLLARTPEEIDPGYDAD
jgi:predicted Zn-dependent protease with MMP-like domain